MLCASDRQWTKVAHTTQVSASDCRCPKEHSLFTPGICKDPKVKFCQKNPFSSHVSSNSSNSITNPARSPSHGHRSTSKHITSLTSMDIRQEVLRIPFYSKTTALDTSTSSQVPGLRFCPIQVKYTHPLNSSWSPAPTAFLSQWKSIHRFRQSEGCKSTQQITAIIIWPAATISREALQYNTTVTRGEGLHHRVGHQAWRSILFWDLNPGAKCRPIMKRTWSQSVES